MTMTRTPETKEEEETRPLLAPPSRNIQDEKVLDHPTPVDKSDDESDNTPISPAPDPRFNPPPPSPFKRLLLVAFVISLFWLAFILRANLLRNKKNRNVIYASRYSKEYKYRPAASPVITETLKDGRIRLRGATPPPPTSTPTPVVNKRKSKRKGNRKKRTNAKKAHASKN